MYLYVTDPTNNMISVTFNVKWGVDENSASYGGIYGYLTGTDIHDLQWAYDAKVTALVVTQKPTQKALFPSRTLEVGPHTSGLL